MKHLEIYVFHYYQEAQESTDKSDKKRQLSSPDPKVAAKVVFSLMIEYRAFFKAGKTEENK